MSLHVIQPGLHSLVVDRGRPRTRSLGVPVGGAADQTALAIGNALVGNPPGAPALEVTLAGPTLRAECALACVLYGAPFEIETDRRWLQAGKTFTLGAGEQLRIGTTHAGARAYLCVRGGLQLPEILHSRSALKPIQKGDVLPCSPSVIASAFAHINWSRDQMVRQSREEVVLRVLPGPQASWFPEGSFLSAGRSQSFHVSTASNRMGLRLQGPPLPVPGRELVSEPVCPGSIQVTRDGQCIVLGVDGQTIGGYPKIAQVISVDLDRLGQIRPGEAVVFERIDQEQAEQLYRQHQREVRSWVLRLRTSTG